MSFILLALIFTLISICLAFAQYQLDKLEKRVRSMEHYLLGKVIAENEVDD